MSLFYSSMLINIILWVRLLNETNKKLNLELAVRLFWNTKAVTNYFSFITSSYSYSQMVYVLVLPYMILDMLRK